jgi:TRAP-type C4-dicarboxylate transport system substrate-binding protein
MFDELWHNVPPEEYSRILKECADRATERTRDLRATSDDAFKAYCKAQAVTDEAWKIEWAKARDELIAEEQK